jgi:hypothetical protein
VDFPTGVASVGSRKHFDDDWEFRDGYTIYDLEDKVVKESIGARGDALDLSAADVATQRHLDNSLNGIRTGERLHTDPSPARSSATPRRRRCGGGTTRPTGRRWCSGTRLSDSTVSPEELSSHPALGDPSHREIVSARASAERAEG